MKALSREEFAAALKKGLGRAWWHVAEHGLDEVVDLVLEACLHDQRYDSSECSRADWLFEMFGVTVHYRRFHAAILAALQSEANAWEAEQLCGLAKAMAAQGDDEARQTLKDFVFDKASQRADDDSLGAAEWIELTGVEGVLDLARIYGQRLVVDSADNPGNLWWSDEDKTVFHAALLQHAQTDQAIAAYCKYLEASGAFIPRQPFDREAARQQRRQYVREHSPLERVLDEANNSVGEYPGRYMTFGRYATPEELETVYAALLNTANDAARVRLLWVFRHAPLPQLADVFFDWAKSDNDQLRKAILFSLSQVADIRTHALAQSKVTSGRLTGADCESLRLFLHNYQSEDAALINTAIAAVHSGIGNEDAHSLSSHLISLVEQHDDHKLVPALRWAYENTPCTLCRISVVKLLHHFDALDDTLVQECLHDAEEDIRTIAQQRLNASPLSPLLTTDDQPI